MTDVKNCLFETLQQGKPIIKHRNEIKGEKDQCRICLEHGNDLVNLFNEQFETPSIVDKLMECSRISQVDFPY